MGSGSKFYEKWLAEAVKEAEAGLREGGIPIGSVLGDPVTGEVVSCGHNRRVQDGSPTAHAEVVAINNAGRRRDWHKLVLVSTLRYYSNEAYLISKILLFSPCIMCTGTALLLKIPEVVVGENKTFSSFAEDVMKGRGVRMTLVQDARCIAMMEKFIKDKPDLWNEDIHDVET